MRFICSRRKNKKKKVYPIHNICKSIKHILSLMTETIYKKKKRVKINNLIYKVKKDIYKMPDIEIKYKLENTINKIERVFKSGTDDILIKLFAVRQLRILPNYLEIKYKQRYWT
jgi:hypothetical protein